jgi:hypothetical protein
MPLQSVLRPDGSLNSKRHRRGNHRAVFFSNASVGRIEAAISAAPGESLPQAFAFVTPRCHRVMTALERGKDFE